MAERRLLQGGSVITMDPGLGNLDVADVLVEGGRIVEVGSDLTCEDGEVIDARGKIVAPGLIDTHRHVWQSVLRYVAADWRPAD